MKHKQQSIDAGVVTFLDVLGWRGIYNRQSDAIGKLTAIIADGRKKSKKWRGSNVQNIEIKSISDTIAIFTFCSNEQIMPTIEAHGELCASLIRQSITAGIPVRGATAFGDFEINDNIFVGKAVDEAASWHEQSDWIGVHLTPSADYVFESDANSYWARYTPPCKTRQDWQPYCVDWTKDWESPHKEIQDIKFTFRQLGPIVPEISVKFNNTLRYIYERQPLLSQK